MGVRFLLLVTVVVALLAGAASGDVRVYLAPQGGCDQALIRLARSAQTYLDAACLVVVIAPAAKGNRTP